ncbi:hypothetical protein [Streptomyces antimicrobicus]|uniref:Uncharacterized protein n=1 Tax=Streptomyces antimicrobicus TaxID=2883108 RepID=A0ABS8B6F6_9ACTN|nr:hypothetical protein [Streptomyces antimicrobicus]MCB5180200.1 hypothetical protein [Streptomyces antimicrobicus]
MSLRPQQGGRGVGLGPDRERLAFPVRPELGELDHPTLYAAPHPVTVRPCGPRPT